MFYRIQSLVFISILGLTSFANAKMPKCQLGQVLPPGGCYFLGVPTDPGHWPSASPVGASATVTITSTSCPGGVAIPNCMGGLNPQTRLQNAANFVYEICSNRISAAIAGFELSGFSSLAMHNACTDVRNLYLHSDAIESVANVAFEEYKVCLMSTLRTSAPRNRTIREVDNYITGVHQNCRPRLGIYN